VIDERLDSQVTMLDWMGRMDGSESEGERHCGLIGEREAFSGAMRMEWKE
jgi:hypothetical protein